MFKLFAAIKKDLLILFSDKTGLLFMFLMPIMLAIVITAIQNSTFELVNNNKIKLLLVNNDSGNAGKQLSAAIEKIGMFELKTASNKLTDSQVKVQMHHKDALLAVMIPADFSEKINTKAKHIANNALNKLGLLFDTATITNDSVFNSLTLYYHPVLQESFRASVKGALRSSLLLIQNEFVIQNVYQLLNENAASNDVAAELTHSEIPITEVAIMRNSHLNQPNATQHNIPAWTIFAMFFIVVSLGSSIVRDKLSGSFIRLKTLPANFSIILLSKEITYLFITLLQAAIIFSIGRWLFPLINLPQLHLPTDALGLCIVSIICGWCAVSFSICLGVFAQTQEQANGIGAVSIVLLAAIGGLLVPSFAMPASFQSIMKFSPLHWCLEAYNGLFLENGNFKDILINILPLLIMIILFHLIAIINLKIKKLI
jgi:ABC-2 type transport system permease protein